MIQVRDFPIREPVFAAPCKVRLHETLLLVESNVLDYYYYNIDIHDNR